MWGIGGLDGWLDWIVMKRGKNVGNSMNYKDDMGMKCLIFFSTLRCVPSTFLPKVDSCSSKT